MLGGSSLAKANAGDSTAVSSVEGVQLNCTNVRTGESFQVPAQRLMLSGGRDESWSPSASRVCLGSIDGQLLQRVSDSQGGAFIAWVDGRHDEPDIYLQHVDATGAVAANWPAEGLPVCTARLSQYNLAISADGSGGVYLVWEDYRGGTTGDIFASRITADATIAEGWLTSGTPVCLAAGAQTEPTISAGSGQVFIAWQDSRAGAPQLFGTSFDGQGTVTSGWSIGGSALSNAVPCLHPHAFADSTGRAALVWEDASSSTVRLKVGLLNPSISSLSPILDLSTEATYSAVEVAPYSQHVVVLSWSEWRADSATARLQLLNFSTDLAVIWASTSVGVHRDHLGPSPAAVVADGSGGVVVAWEDFRSGEDSHIYTARVLSTGALDADWPAEGLAACTTEGSQFRPQLSRDSASVIVTWTDAGTGVGSYLAQRPDPTAQRPRLVSVTATPGRVRLEWALRSRLPAVYSLDRRVGETEWEHHSELLRQHDRTLAVDDRTVSDGDQVLYRLICRDTTGIAYLLPIEVTVPVAPKVLLLHAVIPHGGAHDLTVLFSLPRGPAPVLDLLDVTGRRVTSLRLDGLEPGERRERLPLSTSQPPGVYFLRLSQGNEHRVAKTVYVR